MSMFLGMRLFAVSVVTQHAAINVITLIFMLLTQQDVQTPILQDNMATRHGEFINN